MSLFSEKKDKKPFWDEFKDFALSFSIADMALGWVLGSAAWELIGSIIVDVLFPFFGLSEISVATLTINGVTISYGSTLSIMIGFIFVLLIAFIYVKLIQHLHRKGSIVEEKETDENTELLREMRDLLQEMNERDKYHEDC